MSQLRFRVKERCQLFGVIHEEGEIAVLTPEQYDKPTMPYLEPLDASEGDDPFADGDGKKKGKK